MRTFHCYVDPDCVCQYSVVFSNALKTGLLSWLAVDGTAAIVEFPSPLGDLVKGVGHVAERRLAIPEGRASAASTRTPWSEVSGLDLAITPRALGPAAWDQLTDRLTDAAGPRSITEVEATDHLLPAVAGRTCFAVVDASANPQLAQAFQVREVPAVANTLSGF